MSSPFRAGRTSNQKSQGPKRDRISQASSQAEEAKDGQVPEGASRKSTKDKKVRKSQNSAHETPKKETQLVAVEIDEDSVQKGSDGSIPVGASPKWLRYLIHLR